MTEVHEQDPEKTAFKFSFSAQFPIVKSSTFTIFWKVQEVISNNFLL